jgi:hypothetical protein
MKNLTWKRRIVANCTRLLILSPNGLRGFESHRFRQRVIYMMSEKEQPPLIFGKGVAAVLSYRGNLYGIPTQSEDRNKFEVATLDKNGSKNMDYGYLKDVEVGFVGGRVEGGETLREALEREIIAELAEVTSSSPEEISEGILPSLNFEEPRKIDGLKVFQARQSDEKGPVVPRGAFEIYLTTIELTAPIFEKIKAALIKIDQDDIEQLRPLAASVIGNKLQGDETSPALQ